MNNPLLESFDTAPFSKLKNEHFLPAIQELIAITKSEIDRISCNADTPTFENTIEALAYTGSKLDRATSIFFNLNNAETSEEIQKLAQDISPMISEFRNDLLLNEKLFERVKLVYEQSDQDKLTSEQRMLLEKQYKDFARNGANLSDSQKSELRTIDTSLARLKLIFGKNVLAETNKYELHIKDPEDLSGLPDGVVEAASNLATEKDKDGWIFTLEYPSYVPFMKYSKNRDLRRKLALAFGSKGFHNDEHDNQKNILEIVRLRHKRANLLGYPSHAHFVLEERMAETPEKVQSFLLDLLDKAKPAAQKEFTELQEFAKNIDGIATLQKWDGAYYAEMMKKEKFDLDDEMLKPYFKLENVIEGVFRISEKLYGLTFEEVFTIDKYHNDVKTYIVRDGDKELNSILYADFHPRPGKRGGAWMTSFKPQQILNGINERPHISIVCNFTKPTANKPSLLTFNEVTTLFHEFGHALHGMLANTTYKSLSGTNVYWDFVELPSQILENWCYEQEALEMFAIHYQTGEMIPMELIHKIKESATFHEGMQTLRQLSFGLLDMTWHGSDPTPIENVKSFENSVMSRTDLYPVVAENCMSTSFSHIFQGGYSAGYYSYKWAEVLDADAFAFFKEKGIFNREVADRFKELILSKGGTQDPMELYVKFRGKEPDPEALLKRAGLIKY